MHRLTEETRYDDAAQRQILSLAAELQRYEQAGATLADLERRAREAGIDPKYVRMAAGHAVETPRTAVPPLAEKPWWQNNEITVIAVVGFTLVQMVTVYGFMQRSGVAFPLALLFAPLLGLAFSRTSAHRLGAVAAVLGSTLSTVVLILLGSALTRARLTSGWEENVFFVLLIELIALGIGFLIAAIARWVRKKAAR